MVSTCSVLFVACTYFQTGGELRLPANGANTGITYDTFTNDTPNMLLVLHAGTMLLVHRAPSIRKASSNTMKPRNMLELSAGR